MENENDLSPAADFRKLAEVKASAEYFEEPQRVVLPKSALAVMLRRPLPRYFLLMGLPLPMSLAAHVVRGDPGPPEFSEDDLRLISQRIVALFSAAFVSPRLSLNPGPDEISPYWIPDEDAGFLMRYLVGEVLASGQNLDTFRGTSGPANSGTNSGDVGLPTESTAALG